MPPGLFIKRRAVWLSCVFATTLALGWIFWPAQAPVAEPLPSPNGYDDFVKAGKFLAPISSDYSKMPPEQLRAYVSTNQESLRLLRLGLTRECRKPIEYTRDFYRQHMGKLRDLKRLCQLVSAEGRLAEAEGRYLHAAISHIDNLNFGRVSAQGGLAVDKLAGIGIEYTGIVGIERLAEKLSAAEAKTVLGRTIDRDEVPDLLNEFIARDYVFLKQTITLSERLRLMWEYETLSPERVGYNRFIERIHITTRLRRRLMLRLAAHLYQLEKGSPPRQISDLVPDILPTIPIDPETGTNLVLNPSK